MLEITIPKPKELAKEEIERTFGPEAAESLSDNVPSENQIIENRETAEDISSTLPASLLQPVTNLQGKKSTFKMNLPDGRSLEAEADMDFTKMFDSSLMTIPQERVTASFYNPNTNSIDGFLDLAAAKDNPSLYTIDDFMFGKENDPTVSSVVGMMRKFYTDDKIKELSEEDQKKLLAKHAHFSLVQNPRMLNYFKTHYPEELNALADKITEYAKPTETSPSKITVGVDALGQDIFIGQQLRTNSVYGIGPIIPETPTWFNPVGSLLGEIGFEPTEMTVRPFISKEDINIARDISKKEKFASRILYENVVGLASWTLDFILTPKDKGLDFFENNPIMSPKTVAKVTNKLIDLNVDRIAAIARTPFDPVGSFKTITDPNRLEKRFTDAEIENITTYSEVFNKDKEATDKGFVTGETAVDKLTSYMANSPIFNFLNLNPSQQRDRRYNIPSGTFIGANKELLDEEFGVIAIGIAGGRGIIQAFKTSKFDNIDPKKFREQLKIVRSKIDDLRGLDKSKVKKAKEAFETVPYRLQAMKDVSKLHAQEQAFGAGAVLTQTYMPNLIADEGTTAGTLEKLAYTFTLPAIAVLLAPTVGAKMIDTALFYPRKIGPIMEGNFDLENLTPAMRELLKTRKGRKIVNNFQKANATLARERPEQYKLIQEQFIAFNEGIATTRKVMIENAKQKLGVEKLSSEQIKNIDSIMDSVTKVRANSFGLIHVESALGVTQSQYLSALGTKVQKDVKGKKLTDTLLLLEESKELARLHDKSMVGVGEALIELTANLRNFEGSIPLQLRETLATVNRTYTDGLPINAEYKQQFVGALTELYDIAKLTNTKNINPENALLKVQSLYNRLDKIDPNLTKEFNNQIRKILEVDPNVAYAKGFGGFAKTLEKHKPIAAAIKMDIDNTNALNEVLVNANLGFIKDGQFFLNKNLRPEAGVNASVQYNLVNTARETARKKASAQYDKFYAQTGNTKLVSGQSLVNDLANLVKDQGLNYGSDGRNKIIGALATIRAAAKTDNQGIDNSIKYLQDNFDDLIKMTPDELNTVFADLMGDSKFFNLKELVKLRQDAGQNSWKALKNNDFTSSAVYMQIHKIIDTAIDTSLNNIKRPDIVKGLREVQENYKTTVADLYYDPYIAKGLKAGDQKDIGLPFRLMFSNDVADGTTRRDIFDRIFVDAGPRKSAVEQMRITLLDDLFKKTEGQTSANTFITSLRELSDPNGRAGKQLFLTEDRGGFLDILVPNVSKFKELHSKTPFKNEQGKFTYSNPSPASKFEQTFKDDIFLRPDGTVNKDNIKQVIGNVVKRAEDDEALDTSITLPILRDIAKNPSKQLNVNKELLNTVFDPKITDKESLERLTSMLNDVDMYAPDQAEFMVQALKQITAEELLRKGGITLGEKVPLTEANIVDFDAFLKTRPETLKKLFGEESLQNIKDFTNAIQIYSSPNSALLSITPNVTPMSVNGLISRSYGYARGVVSARYIGVEFLAKKLLSAGNKDTLAVLATDGFADVVMEGVVKANRMGFSPDAGFRSKFITTLAGAMVAERSQNYEEEYIKNLNALNDFCRSAAENNTECMTDLASLIFVSKNETVMKSLFGEPLDEKEKKLINQLEKLYKDTRFNELPNEKNSTQSQDPVNQQLRNLKLK